MSGRKLLGLPIRDATEWCYPYKMTLDEFIKDMHANLDGYAKNMKMHPDISTQDRYIEEWTESMLAWSEIEEARP